jgi:tetratricopeptide (TPR) repeat protein
MPEKKDFLFGNIALKKGYLSPAQLNECLGIQEKMRKFGLAEKRIGEIAVEKGYLTSEQLDDILSIQRAIFEAEAKKEQQIQPSAKESSVKESSAEVKVAPAPVPRQSKLATYQQSILVGKMATAVALVIILVVIAIIVVKLIPSSGSENLQNESLPTGETNPVSPTPSVVVQRPSDTSEETVAEVQAKAQREWLELSEFIKNNREKTDEIIKRLEQFACKYPDSDEGNTALALIEVFKSAKQRTASEGTQPRGEENLEEQACNFFLQISEQVIRLKAEDKFYQALELYRSFPEKFKGTSYWDKVQREAKRLQGVISERYSDDIDRINTYLAQKKYDEATKVAEEINRYAPPDYVKVVREKLREYIAAQKQATSEEQPAGAQSELEQKLSMARMLVQNRVYPEAMKLYEEIKKSKQFVDSHPDVVTEINELGLLMRLYKAVEDAFSECINKHMVISLERLGKVDGKVVEVKEMRLTLSSQTRGIFTLPFVQISSDTLKQFAFRKMGEDEPESWMALALLYLERGRLKDAEKALFEALRRPGANQEEIRRLMGRLSGGSPISSGGDAQPAGSDVVEGIYKEAEEKLSAKDYAAALLLYQKLLNQHSHSEFVKKNRTEIEGKLAECRKNLTVASSVFAGRVLKRPDIGFGVFEVFYDFSEDSQLKDWKEYNWYSIFDMHDSVWQIENGELRGSGSHGFLWKGIIDGDVILEFDAYSTDPRRPNIQATICDDGEKGYNYLFGVGLVELGPALDVIRYNQHAALGIDIAKKNSKAKPMQKYHIKIQKKGNILSLWIDEEQVLSVENSRYQSGHISLFAIGSTVKYDNLRIIGRINEKAMK